VAAGTGKRWCRFWLRTMASTSEENAGYDEKLLEFEKSGRFYSVLESQ
jgi:hypothetical protein